MYESLGLDEINPQVLAMIVVGLVLLGTILVVYFMSPKSNLTVGTGTDGSTIPGEVLSPAPQTPSSIPTPPVPAPPVPTPPVPTPPVPTIGGQPPSTSTGVGGGVGGDGEQAGLGTGAIVGIVFAALIGLVVVFFTGKKGVQKVRQLKAERKRNLEELNKLNELKNQVTQYFPDLKENNNLTFEIEGKEISKSISKSDFINQVIYVIRTSNIDIINRFNNDKLKNTLKKLFEDVDRNDKQKDITKAANKLKFIGDQYHPVDYGNANAQYLGAYILKNVTKTTKDYLWIRQTGS